MLACPSNSFSANVGLNINIIVKEYLDSFGRTQVFTQLLDEKMDAVQGLHNWY